MDGKMQTEQVLTFEGLKFNPVKLKAGQRQDGLDRNLSIYIDADQNTLVAVDQNNNVVLKVIGDGLTEIPLD